MATSMDAQEPRKQHSWDAHSEASASSSAAAAGRHGTLQGAAALTKRLVRVAHSEFQQLCSAEHSKRQQSYLGRRGCAQFSCCMPVLPPTSAFYAFWSLAMLLLDLSYTAVVCPVSVAFAPREVGFSPAFVLDFIAGLAFTADIFLQFNTGYVVQHGMQQRTVMQRRSIARLYLRRGPFVVDAASSIAWLAQVVVLVMAWAGADPQGSIEAAHALRVARILRMLRVLRLLKQLYLSHMGGRQRLLGLRPHTLHTLQLAYVAAVIINFCGCMWAFAAREGEYQGSWMTRYAPFINRYGDGADPLTADEVGAIPAWDKWLTSTYWASTTVLTVGYGDIVPWSPLEQGVCVAVQLLGICFFGALLSSIAALIQRASKAARRGQALDEKLGSIERYMRQQGVRGEVRRRIKRYYADVWLEQQDGLDVGAFFAELPHTLRTDMAWSIVAPSLTHLRCFRAVADQAALRALAGRLQPLQLPPGYTLCEEGEEAAASWVLHEGLVCVSTRRDLDGEEEEEEVEGPALLGEAALLGPARGHPAYHASLRTLTRCLLFRMDASDFAAALRTRPQALEAIRTVLLHGSASPARPPHGAAPPSGTVSFKLGAAPSSAGGEVALLVDARRRSVSGPLVVVRAGGAELEEDPAPMPTCPTDSGSSLEGERSRGGRISL